MMVPGILLLVIFLQVTSALLIGNYPHPILNETILPQDVQLDVYARIFGRYDITGMSNIRNKTDLEMVADIFKQLNSNIEFYLSPLIDKPGANAVEYYGVFYRSDLVTVSDFIRDQPSGAYSMRIQVKGTGQEFVLSLVHLVSRGLLQELESLPSVYERLRSFYNLESVLFVGDFNTVDFFTSEAEVANLNVTRDPRFRWFIDYTDNAIVPILTYFYGAAPRFLARGDILNWVVPDSAAVFNTMEFFNLTLAEAAGLGVFFPVELELMEPILKP